MKAIEQAVYPREIATNEVKKLEALRESLPDMSDGQLASTLKSLLESPKPRSSWRRGTGFIRFSINLVKSELSRRVNNES